jgi:hypothetical protein
VEGRDSSTLPSSVARRVAVRTTGKRLSVGSTAPAEKHALSLAEARLCRSSNCSPSSTLPLGQPFFHPVAGNAFADESRSRCKSVAPLPDDLARVGSARDEFKSGTTCSFDQWIRIRLVM